MADLLHPQVKVTEVDQSQNVPNINSSSAAIVGYSPKGSMDVRLITDTQQFLNEYCVDGRVELANYFQYSALAYLTNGNALYCQRVVNGSLYGGMKIKTSDSAESNEALAVGVASPAFTSVSGEDNLFYIFAKDPGVWNDKLSVIIENVDETEYTFDIKVYITDIEGTSSLVETWTVSRKNQLDGYGQQQYLEDKINDYSSYIVVKDDTSQANTVVPKENATAVTFDGGSDGSAVTSSEVSTGWDSFDTVDEYDIRMLINAGYADAVVQTKMNTIASTRKDCFAILDIPYDSINTVANMVTFRTTTSNLNSSYAGMYGPWIKVNDNYNKQIVGVPVSGYIAGIYAYNDSVAEAWTAPAGTSRGIVTQALGLYFGADTSGKRSFTSGELDTLQTNQINPIINKPGYGIVVWGQKTQQTKASALDRVNVRRSLIIIEKASGLALDSFLFELNNATTRFRVKSTLDEYLGRLAARGAFNQDTDAGFSVVCDTTNNTPAIIDNNELIVDMYVKPARVAEYIKLKVIVTKSGVNLDEISAQGVIL